MADVKISEMTTASQINNEDNVELSQSSAGSGFMSVKATILAIAQKIVNAINFTSDLQTTEKTITGAINEVDAELDEVYELTLINGWSGQIFATVNRNGRITCLSGALIYTSNVTSPIFARADTNPQNCITNRSVPVATQGGSIYNAVGGTDVIGFGQDAQGWYATLNSQDHNVVMNAVYGRA